MGETIVSFRPKYRNPFFVLSLFSTTLPPLARIEGPGPVMTSLRASFFAVLFALATASLSAGSLSGSISFEAKRGQRPDPSEAVVWLQPLDRSVPVTPQDLRMVTRSKVLVPHVMTVPVGSTVRFPNEDPITHNLFSVSPSNPFDLGLYRRGEGKQERFEKPGVVNVYCNVHPNMSAVLVVLDSPFWAHPRLDGSWSIDAPPGKYRLHVWHEQGGTAESLVQLGANGRATGETNFRLDSRRHRTSPHLNKHGKPYSRVRDY